MLLRTFLRHIGNAVFPAIRRLEQQHLATVFGSDMNATDNAALLDHRNQQAIQGGGIVKIDDTVARPVTRGQQDPFNLSGQRINSGGDRSSGLALNALCLLLGYRARPEGIESPQNDEEQQHDSYGRSPCQSTQNTTDAVAAQCCANRFRHMALQLL